MKEFSITFDKGFRVGLAPIKTERNVQVLYDVLNARIGKAGLEEHSPPLGLSADLPISWPNPMCFIGSKYFIVATSTGIYSIDFANITEGINFLTANTIDDELGDPLTDESSSNITWTIGQVLTGLTPGTPWDFTDFGSFLVLTNGSIIVFIDYITDPDNPVFSSMASSSTFPRCRTYCNFKGQLIGGNVVTDWYGCGTSSVIWSKIGSVDFTPVPSGEAGLKILSEWAGAVYKVLRLGNRVVVYGANGIISMIPAGATFGWKELLATGVPSKTAVAGDEYEHVCVDNLYRIWRINEEAATELDYRQHISTLTKANIVVSKDVVEGDYYISDGVKTYLLTKTGLSRVSQLPTSIIRYNGEFFGILKTAANPGFRAELGVFDLGIRGRKTITALEFGLDGDGPFYSHINWKNGYKDTYTASPDKRVNNDGIVYPIVTANDFRVVIDSPNFTGVNLDSVIVRFNFTDKRSTRGRLNIGG